MMEYSWPGNIRELENLVKRYVIVGNEPQIIRELSTHKPILSSVSGTSPLWGIKDKSSGQGQSAQSGEGVSRVAPPPVPKNEAEMPSLLEIGKRAAMLAEREAIERVLAQTRWNRRQAAKILKISYKALLNKLKVIEEQNQAQTKQRLA
jgi:DNA-binding NtrC family response regulator